MKYFRSLEKFCKFFRFGQGNWARLYNESQASFRNGYFKWQGSGGKRRQFRFAIPAVGACSLSRVLMAGLFLGKGEEQVTYYIRIAKTAQQQGNLADAENYFHTALHHADLEFEKKLIDPTRYKQMKALIYDSLGNMAYFEGEYGKAEKLYKETIKYLLAVGVDKSENSVLEISLKLANLYVVMKKDEEAVSGYLFVIDSIEEKIKKNTEEYQANKENCVGLLGVGYENYAKYLRDKGRSEAAEKLLIKAEEIAGEYLGKNHPQRIVLLNDIAAVQINGRDYVNAEKMLKTAIDAGKETDDEALPVLYCNLGSLHLRTRQYDDALEACYFAQKLAKKKGNKDAEKNADKCIDLALEEKQKAA